MPKYIVELRGSSFHSSEEDPVEGYLGLVHRGDRFSPAVGCVKDRSGALEYDDPRQPNYDLRKLPDAFFDRYWTKVVPVTLDTPSDE